MTPQEKQLLEDLRYRLDVLERPDRYVFEKPAQFNKGFTGVTSIDAAGGLTIGTASQSLGFFGHAPVVRQSAVTTPSGGGASDTDAIDITGRTAIGQIKTALQNLGFTA